VRFPLTHSLTHSLSIDASIIKHNVISYSIVTSYDYHPHRTHVLYGNRQNRQLITFKMKSRAAERGSDDEKTCSAVEASGKRN